MPVHKWHQAFLHCLVPRENGHLAIPMPSSSAFVHKTIIMNIGGRGWGEVKRKKKKPLNRICRRPMVWVSLSVTPGCVALQALPLAPADPGAVAPPAQSQEQAVAGARSTSREGEETTQKPERKRSFCTFLRLLHKPFPPPPP